MMGIKFKTPIKVLSFSYWIHLLKKSSWNIITNCKMPKFQILYQFSKVRAIFHNISSTTSVDVTSNTLYIDGFWKGKWYTSLA
jgi:hypothetical protein